MPNTSYHSWTMPTVDGSTDAWGQILNDMFDNEIDADVERRGTLANRPAAVDVPAGAKYVVTSGNEVGTVYIESSDSWAELGRVVDDDPTFGNVTTESSDGVLWADSPDDMASILSGLSDGNVTVKLRRGVYDETDWTQTITIPRFQDNTAPRVDMFDAKFVAQSDTALPDPMIELPSGTDSDDRVAMEFIGPSYTDVSVVSSANVGTFASMWDMQNSHIWVPKTEGPFNPVIQKDQNVGSGHMNLIRFYTREAEKTLEIGANSNPSSDRTIFIGQATTIRETAFHIHPEAKNNIFWCQPENNSSSPTSTATGRDQGVVGYRIEGFANTVLLCHRLTDTPMWITGRDTHLGPNVLTSSEIMRKSIVRSYRPMVGNVLGSYLRFEKDETGLYDTTGTVSLNDFGSYVINAGQTDGDIAELRTAGRVGNISNKPLSTTGVIDSDGATGAKNMYYGIIAVNDSFTDADASYVAFVYEPGTSSNWLFRHVNNGTVETETDTGETVADAQYDMTVVATDTSSSEQYCYGLLGTTNEEQADTYLSGGSVSDLIHARGATCVEVAGSPGSDQRILHPGPQYYGMLGID